MFGRILFIIFGIAIILFAIFYSRPAPAETITDMQKHVCVSDFMALCKSSEQSFFLIAPKLDLKACFRDHHSEISPRCLRVLSEYGL